MRILVLVNTSDLGREFFWTTYHRLRLIYLYRRLRLEISKNRKLHIEEEISGYVSQISKVNKQQEVIQKKIHEDFIIGQNEKDLKNHQNFKVKNVL